MLDEERRGRAERNATTSGMRQALLAAGTWVDVLFSAFSERRVSLGVRSRTRDDIRFVDVGEALVRVRERSQARAPWLVMFIDPPLALEQYDALFAELDPHFRVVAFEVPGFGFSRIRPGFDFSPAAYARAFARLIEAIGAAPCTFVAPCVFAYGALRCAAERPDLIEKVVTLQVPSWSEELNWKRDRDPHGTLHTPVVGQLSLFAGKRRRAPKWLGFSVGDASRVSELQACADAAFADGAHFSLATAFQRYLTSHETAPPTLKQPLLAVWGDRDASHHGTSKGSSAELSEHTEIVHLPTVGHLPELEAPHLVASHVRRFAIP